MRSTNAIRIVALAALVFAAFGPSTATAAEHRAPGLPAYGFERIEGSTLAALQVACGREMNARKDYEIFARIAEREGHARVARLFVAIASAEETHARAHAENIARLGGTLDEWVPTSVVLGATAANLARSIENERSERAAVYRVFAEYARLEGAYEAHAAFHYAGGAEATHAAMFADALKDLRNETARPTLLASLGPVWMPASDVSTAPVAWVCGDCGSAFHARPGRSCPTCGASCASMKVFL